ncbi:MAG: glycoside hydrolase family 2, partial [Flavobacteriaceae bacterium]|nr:glycoside hydrolase family 2 [Flavobacteriaceae bacterium]
MSQAQERQVFNLNSNWKFTKGNPENATKDNYNDSSWEDVIIPHDWAISGPFMIEGDGNTGKLPWKGEGWYRKKINISESYQEKRIYLIFDGIMAFPEVFVNGIFAGSWDYGYNSFYLNITKFVQFGKDNTLAIYANTKNHDSRWYPGAGIYRKIRMVVVNPVHIAIWGTYVTSPIIKPNYAAVRIRATVHNDSSEDQKIKVEHAILSAEGLEITKQDLEKPILKGMHR